MKVLLFGIMKDIAGGRTLELADGFETVGALRRWLLEQYPAMGSLKAVMIAVNQAYAGDEVKISPGDEVALIPPLSGG